MIAARVISYGGGLDSWVMLLEAVRRGELIDACVFVDVGRPGVPGEWPSTYRHIREVVMPFCEKHGIRFVWITGDEYPVRDASSLFEWLKQRKQIPVAGPDRICTIVAKVERFERWLDANYPGHQVEVWVGFDADEADRIEKDPNAGTVRRAKGLRVIGAKHELSQLRNAWRWTIALAFALSSAQRVNRFPLYDWKLCRCRCEAIARASGHPVPRKSACVFCPYGSRGDWQTFAVEMPEDFAQVVELESSKPVTGEGFKLSIMGFDKRRKSRADTPLTDFVAKPYTKKRKPCSICGAADAATKATGCTYLAEAA